jgi:hydroxyethylthiazole kinase-like uncharacterized protein yjeF
VQQPLTLCNRAAAGLELLTPAEMGEADRLAAAAGRPGRELMEHAGAAVARAVRRRQRPCRTLVLCGPGNNGGDGYVVARHLAQQGWPVAVAALAPPRPGGDAWAAASRWRGPMAAFTPAAAARAELVIDAVFGAGLVRDLDGLAADTLRAARRVIAIDVPSGVDGANGAQRGFAPRCEATVTFFRLKPGHVLEPGRSLCGEILLRDIGLPAQVLEAIRPAAWLNQPGLWSLRRAAPADHKYARGHVTVLGGARMTGAARLAAMAARRGGAGLVTIAALEGMAPYVAAERGVIVSDAKLDDLLADTRRQVWVCGPGLGVAAARAALPALLDAGRQVVVDADGLTAFADAPAALGRAAVLTPHAGEFARLFGDLAPTDRLAAARTAARRLGCVVLLKGSDTVVAAPDGRASINASAPPWLATAGAGDVLAGLIAALLAQGLAPWQAASAGAWLHGRAAQLAGPGMIAEDLEARLAEAINFAATTLVDAGEAVPQ